MVKITMRRVACKVRIAGELSEELITINGRRQGDALACVHFHLALEKVIRGTELDLSENIFNGSMQILAYTDDINIIGWSKAIAFEYCPKLKRAAENMGLTIIMDKTKSMKVANGRDSRLVVEGSTAGIHVEEVEKFTYVGSSVSERNRVTAEITIRLRQANGALGGIKGAHIRVWDMDTTR